MLRFLECGALGDPNDMPRIQLGKQSAWISNAALKVEDESDESDAESEDDRTQSLEVDNRLRVQAERDESFMSNLDYLVGGKELGKLVEAIDTDEENSTPPSFICFSREGTRFYIKKASLLWWLSSSGKRVSTDRVQRFIEDREKHSDDVLQTGDFVEILHGKRKRIAQILRFRFTDGKAFYGYRYEGRDKRGVEALCNLYELKNGIVSGVESSLCYVNVKSYKKHIHLKRDLASGNLRLA